MPIEVLMGGSEEEVDSTEERDTANAEDFFARHVFRMVYQTNNFLLRQVCNLIDTGQVINVRPAYQRRLRWKVPQKSRLIESLLLNIPIPPIFLYETELARYEVMDGQQRLNAVQEFISGTFALSGLPILTPLNGSRYADCPPRIKRTLDRATLSTVVLLLESEASDKDVKSLTLKDIRRFIFDRLNTGGTRLNSQEIRNALYPGVFNKLLIDISRLPLFTDIFDIPPYIEATPNEYYENPKRQRNTLYASMGDCQLVLRYFALKEEENIRGSMKSMLDRTMEHTSLREEEAPEWRESYEHRLTCLYELFDGRPFRLPRTDTSRERVSAAIYDASMVAVDSLWERREEIRSDKDAVRRRMQEAINDGDTLPVLTGQRNTAEAVRARISLMREILLPTDQ